MKSLFRWPLAGVLVLSLAAPMSQAALSIGATRIVYEGADRSTTVMVRNPSQRVYAAQVWVNTADDDTTTAVPFMPAPPLYRLDPGSEQLVRITGLPHALPQDRESLFFLNVQEIPEANAEHEKGNTLTLALRTRIKFFYRPTPIAGDPTQQLDRLTWQLQGGSTLIVDNPTPYHFTFNSLEVNGPQGQERIKNPPMVAPFSQQHFPLQRAASGTAQVTFTAINDYGANTAPLQAQAQPTP